MKHMCVGGGQDVWLKDLEGDTNKWKPTPCSLSGRVNYVNMSIVTKAIDRCVEIPIWIPVALFEEIEDSPKTCMESQKTPNTQSNLEKERCSQHTPGLQARLQSCSHQNRMVLASTQTSGQWSRTESSETNPHVDDPYLWHSSRRYAMREGLSLQWAVTGKLGTKCRRIELGHFLTPHTKFLMLEWLEHKTRIHKPPRRHRC